MIVHRLVAVDCGRRVINHNTLTAPSCHRLFNSLSLLATGGCRENATPNPKEK